MKQNPILVTGGAGFIGTHLCRALAENGFKVRSLDIAHPKKPVQGVEYILGDVRDRKGVEAALRGAAAVFHFAALVSVPLCQEKPVESYETNLMAAARLLDLIYAQNQKQDFKTRMIFSGSSVVYGDDTQLGQSRQEDEKLSAPLSFYGAQKLGAEHLIKLFRQNQGIPAVVFRYFNVYGLDQDPHSPYSGVISIFSGAIAQGKTIRLNGGGFQTRDFVSVKDIVRACLKALELNDDQCDAIPINLGSGKSVSIKELAQMMIAASGKKIPIEVAPARSGDVAHSLAEIARARTVLGWKPEIGLEQGLRELI